MIFLAPRYFWWSPKHLFFTFVIPLIPFCLVFDGYVSSLRTRTPEEVVRLLRKDERLAEWTLLSGEEMHTIPIGWLNWIICTRK
jgi:hypothetical protein